MKKKKPAANIEEPGGNPDSPTLKATTGYSVGRPPVYNTAEEMQAAISKYFHDEVKKKIIILGSGKQKHTVEIEVPTITGLCYSIGFESRQSFYDYEKKPEFSYTVKRARLFIEKEYEEQLQTGNTTGAIFALKNFGWSDKSEVDHTTGGQPITDNKHVIEFVDYSKKE